MARQLIFDLAPDPALGRDDFLITAANELAMATLEQPENWPQGRMLLIGPEGSGKTHMAAIWAAETGAARLPASRLRVEDADRLAAQSGAIVIEDADRAACAAGAEQALFHLWNLSATRGCWLLMTARTPPRDWGLSLPDLASRMASMPVTQIASPDEALLAAVLVKLFADRQIAAPQGLIEWLVPRMERDLGLARRLVARLDAEMLSAHRALTRPLVAAALADLADHGP